MSMILCASCKSKLDESSRFCSYCGSLVNDQAGIYTENSRVSDTTTLSTRNASTYIHLTQGKQVSAEHDTSIINGDEEYDYVLPSYQSNEERLEFERQPTKQLDSDTEILAIMDGFAELPHGNVPIVHGTPHIDGVPFVNGTPHATGGSAASSAAGSSPSTPMQSPSPSTTMHSHHSTPSQGPQHPPTSAKPHSPMQSSHSPYVGWQGDHSTHHMQHAHQTLYQQQLDHHEHDLHHHRHPTSHQQHHNHGSHQHHSSHQELSSSPPHVVPVRKTKRTGKWRPNFLMAMLAGVVIMSGILAVLLLQTHKLAAQAALTLSGSVVPGGLLSVHGSNFTARGNVALTIDRQPATVISSSSVIVEDNGTFDATIQLDPKWAVGSPHYLVATEQSSGQTAQYRIVIPQQPALVSCSKSTDTITRTLGPVNEGQKQAVSVLLPLCTTGSGVVNWTASWDQKQVRWLRLSQSGHIQAPLMQEFQVGASAVGLKAGIYTTTVTFSSQGSMTKMFLRVEFIVRSANSPECINTGAQSLSFTATQGQGVPKAQSVAITNCGKTGSWTASTRTDDGTKWLNVSPTGSSNLQSKASQNITITASSTKLGVGIYTGQVTFKIGSGAAAMAVVDVMLAVLPSNTSCISVNSQSLSFMMFQGQNGPGPQTTTIGNCGSASSWSASTNTNWLSVSPSNGSLNANAMQNVTIRISNVNLQTGKYIGQITFTSGTSSAIVIISFTIQQLQQKPCISVNNQALSFTNIQGQGDPSAQSVTLANCGPTDSWYANLPSGANWLKISPTTGNLNAGASQTVSIAVSSGNLGAGMYTGQITFTTKSGASTVVNVSWNLQAPPPCIQASTELLNFTAIQQEGDPAAQPVTLINCGPIGSWSGSVSDGANWLSIDTSSGNLNAGATQDVSVAASSASLNPNTYNGQITFTSGSSSVRVNVTLTVSPPVPCIQVDQPSLSFTVEEYSNDVQQQTITLTNCGDTGNWSASQPTTDSGPWLSITGKLSGALNHNATDTTTIGVYSYTPDGDSGNRYLAPGTYQGAVTFTITTSTGPNSISVNVILTVSPLKPPHVTVSPSSLDFSSVQQGQAASLLLKISNTGEQTLNWNADTGGAGWVILDTSSGTVQANEQQTIQVTVDTSQLQAGNNPATLTINSNADNPSVSIPISVVVTTPPIMQPSTTSLSFSAGCESPPTQSLPITVTNAGGGTLTWTVGTPIDPSTGNTASWLKVDPGNGSDTSGASSSLTFTVDQTTLVNGTHTATVDITPSAGAPQTVTVTFNVFCVP